MPNGESKFQFVELRKEVLAVLDRVGKIREVDFDTLEAVKLARKPRALIAAINAAILKNGIRGHYRGDLETLKGFLRALK